MHVRLRFVEAVLLTAAVTWAGGCGTRQVTDTPRTATEQLLVAAAVETAVAQLDFEFLADRKVFLEDSLVDRVDKSFIVAEVRSAARQAGAMLVGRQEDAHYVVELRAGAAGTDRTDYILGIPASEIPVPGGGGPLGLPETALYKSITQIGACHVGFVVYAREDGAFFYASGPVYGFADHRSRWILGAGPGVRDTITPPRAPENTTGIRQRPTAFHERAEKPE